MFLYFPLKKPPHVSKATSQPCSDLGKEIGLFEIHYSP